MCAPLNEDSRFGSTHGGGRTIQHGIGAASGDVAVLVEGLDVRPVWMIWDSGEGMGAPHVVKSVGRRRVEGQWDRVLIAKIGWGYRHGVAGHLARPFDVNGQIPIAAGQVVIEVQDAS